MTIELMPLDDIAPNAPGDIYVGAVTSLAAPASNVGDDSHIFEDRRPLGALKALCLLGHMWPHEMSAEGVFWIDSQPDICFRLRIADGVAAYRPAGYWMASRLQADVLPPSISEAITSRAWDSVYGDRTQQLRFTNAGDDWNRIHDMLARCLVNEPGGLSAGTHP
ncbi:MAG: hypothetical protein ACPGQM_14350 [Alphaproteobacteria bacterium]